MQALSYISGISLQFYNRDKGLKTLNLTEKYKK